MEELNEKLKEIKQSFRPMMNGVTSQSMRHKGIGYKLNWGVPYIELKRMAAEHEKDYHLALALWKEDIRECKILATLLMPTEKMQPDLAQLWMEQTDTQETAEMLAFNLFQYLDYAPELAFRWVATEKPNFLICAYQLLSRLFMQGLKLDARDLHEYLDQVEIALQNPNIAVRHAAMNSVKNLMKQGSDYEEIATKALKSLNLTFFT